MSVVLLPRYPLPGQREHEDPEAAAMRMHVKKNKAINPAEDLEFPAYRFRPYPTAMYRKWDEEKRELEILRVAGRNALDLEKRRDQLIAEGLVGQYETINVGVTDYIEHDDRDEVISEIRERNDKQHQAMLEQGWADSPDQVAAAYMAHRRRTLSEPTAERLYEDRRLSDAAKAEASAIEDAAADHVIDIPEERRRQRDTKSKAETK